jgi:cytochrome c
MISLMCKNVNLTEAGSRGEVPMDGEWDGTRGKAVKGHRLLGRQEQVLGSNLQCVNCHEW